MKLVGVNGSAGSVIVGLNLSDQTFQQEVIIANSLMMNFLEVNGCILDLSKGEMVYNCQRKTQQFLGLVRYLSWIWKPLIA